MKTTALLYCCIFFVLNIPVATAQFTEDFSDGNYTANPPWVGGSGNWVVNNPFQLQTNSTIANSTFYLSTASTLATTAQWELSVHLTFNTSSANYVDIFLTASASDLTLTTTNGYFVRIGNTDDEISLYRKASSGAITKIIDGINGITDKSSNTLRIKVTRDAANRLTLLRDITGTGNAYFTEGSVTDATFTSSAWFGILVKQSTAGFFQRHFFDDIEIKHYIPDTTPPIIQTVTPVSANTLDLLFNEPVENASSQLATNYIANHSLGTAATAMLDGGNSALVHLTFAGSFTSGQISQLTVNGVKDLAGNSIVNGNVTFTYVAPYIARQHDVVIDEIMADPSPPVGLPNNEWVEIKNTSSATINLKDWRIGDTTGLSGPMTNYILRPDSFVIVCAASAFNVMATFGTAIAVSNFPSLGNAGDQLVLVSSQNSIVHSVGFKDTWYQNELKKNGGWTLEMMDTKNPCIGFSNWKASTDTRGGTPGKRNSVDTLNPDKKSPRLLRAYATDSLTIILVFDEPLDSLKAAIPANFSISDGIGVAVGAVSVSPVFDRVSLKLSSPLARNKVYTVTISRLTDCSGNTIGTKNSARVGLPEAANPADIAINEILFNPPSNGTDYVEIYNRSKRIIDLKQCYIASRNSTGVISNIIQLSAESYLLFPEDFMVVTKDASIVQSAYITLNMDAFIEVGNMPAFNDDKGTVILINAQGEIMDELAYSEKWHFKLIDNTEGVALERIDYNAPTQSSDNWHSAATSAGYGTPTYKNSQYRINDGVQGTIKLSPEIVSPDNDGQDDFATVQYNFPEPGYVANITVFNTAGRPVRYLQKNALCGTQGNFRWDGLGENSQRLAVGVYIVFTEVFNLKGNKKQFKEAIVLARRN